MEGLMIKVGEGEAGMTKSHRNNNINDKEINQNNNRIDLINELDYLFEHISQQLQEKQNLESLIHKINQMKNKIDPS